MCKVSPIYICLSIVAAFIIAAVLSVLFFFNIAPFLDDLIFIAFPLVAITLIGLTILLILSIKNHNGDLSRCLCCFGKAILIIAKVLFVITLIAFGFFLSPYSILSAIIVFFLVLFVLLLLFYIALFLWCLLKELCSRPCRTDK